VPNVSEGRDGATIVAIGAAFAGRKGGFGGSGREATSGVRVMDVHSDPDHHRAVFTLAGPQGAIADPLLGGARVAIELIDVVGGRPGGRMEAPGQHPRVGALDVAPVVYLDDAARGAACAEALVVADRIGAELDVPVFLYGELTAGDGAPGRTRAQLRRGGVRGLAERMRAGELAPDFGPPQIHRTAGATLVAARPPLVAFNVQLAPPATVADARRIAALIREGGQEGLPGVRAMGVELSGGVAQVSTNVERPFDVPLATVVESVSRHARPARAELVGLAPRAALDGFPASVPLPGFDPTRHVIENALGW